MLYLMKVFLGLCISAVMCGCPLLATLFGYSAYEGYALMLSGDTVEPIINVEQEVGFATLQGSYDIMKADRNEGSALTTDSICISYGDYIGYTDKEENFVPETVISVAGASVDVEREYANTWGTLHVGSLLGGTNATNYKGYFVSEILDLNPADFIKGDNSLTPEGVTYEYYSCKDSVLGLDRMLKLYYSKDGTGVIYMYGVRDYTVSTAPLLDDFTFVNFQADKSFALNEAIGGYAGGGNTDSTLFSLETYEGDWSSGEVWIDEVKYNLHATNLRALESAGVMPFDDKYLELGYDTPTNGGRKDVVFLFGGTRLITLKLEFASGTDKVLSAAKVYGFSTTIGNNFVTPDERVRGSYGIHPTGEQVTEEEFVATYFGGAPYTITKDGELHYFTPDGREITKEEYETLLHGGTIAEPAENESENNTTSAESASENDAETSNSASENDADSASQNESESASNNTATSDADGTEPRGSFADVGDDDGGSSIPETDMSGGDWFVIGGLHSEVSLASLEMYLKDHATKYTTMGSGNSETYTAEYNGAKMIFVLEMNTTISSMEVFYENG